MKYNKQIEYLALSLIFLIILSFFYYNNNLKISWGGKIDENREIILKEEVLTEPETLKKLVEIETGDTYSILMSEKTDLNKETINEIYQASKEIYDLAQIKTGNFIELTYNYKDNEFKELVYKIDTEKELIVRVNKDDFLAETRPIPYETKIIIKEGNIKTSLYEAAMAQNIDERAIIALAEAFQWTLDFAMDPRVGDNFRFIYEEKYLNGEYIRPGKVLAAKYINIDKPYYLYYFVENSDNSGYFDENGNSVQKIFLKAPVSFKYISSGFSTGPRYIKAFNVYTDDHRAIDYAASLGTPIRAVGDGVVTFAGWSGSYGYMVSLRHNSTYSTNYAHMLKMAVKKGDKVKQGDIIGYVGSTGFSTGPHLHYEMVKNGVKINPLIEILPPGESLQENSLAIFKESIKPLKEKLDK
jgi:murein DD-endopeptidase MepM/ murein hydrolase activator NlpD